MKRQRLPIWKRSGQPWEKATTKRRTILQTRHPAAVSRNPAPVHLAPVSAAIAAGASKQATEEAKGVASETNPAAGETSVWTGDNHSQSEATTQGPGLARNLPVINEPAKTETNAAEVTRAPNEPRAAPLNADRAAIDPNKAGAPIKAVEPNKAVVNPAAATSPRLDDLNVNHHPTPHRENRLPVQLTLPAQPPKANQQKRNRCHIGNASPPC